MVYYEAIAMVIFSHVKISSFRTKAHLVFQWCLYNKKRILHGRTEIRNFSLSVEKYFTSERSKQVKYFFNTGREISYLQAAMLCSIYYINTNELPNHFALIVFWCERRDLLCSHSNGDIFTCEDIKFSCESSPGISLVFI